MSPQRNENSSKEIVIRHLDQQHSKLSMVTEPINLFRQLSTKNLSYTVISKCQATLF